MQLKKTVSTLYICIYFKSTHTQINVNFRKTQFLSIKN